MTVIDAAPDKARPCTVGRRRQFLGAPFGMLTIDAVLELLAGASPATEFRYVVTPNVDHVVRLQKSTEIRLYYQQAWLSLCDSRPIAALARLLFLKIPVVCGSDLTAAMFRSVIRDNDIINLIAPSETVVRKMRSAYPKIRFRVHLPPHGLWNNPQALQACVDFAANSQARFTFLAVGSPQSEKIAYELSRRPEARGIGLCIGASLEFLVGEKKRAPLWMRRAGLEWLHRLTSDPKRLWRRYMLAVLPLARLFYSEIVRSGRKAPY